MVVFAEHDSYWFIRYHRVGRDTKINSSSIAKGLKADPGGVLLDTLY